MKKFTMLDAAAIVLWILPGAYLIYVYSSLPATVPVHFGINGTPDRYGHKTEMLTGVFILMGASAFVYVLLNMLPSIDPKKMVKYGEATFQKMALGLVFFLSALTIAIIFATVNKGFRIDRLIYPIIGLLFAFIGNMMNNIKPNYFAGVRTPWALEDSNNWKATHRLAGKLWFTGGIAITIAVLLLPAATGFIVFMSLTGILVFVPYIYSYLYFIKHKQSDQNS